jgi:hypothetical protein
MTAYEKYCNLFEPTTIDEVSVLIIGKSLSGNISTSPKTTSASKFIKYVIQVVILSMYLGKE